MDHNHSVQIVAMGPNVPAEFAIGKRVCVENHYYCGQCYQCTHGLLVHVILQVAAVAITVLTIPW